MTADEIKDMKLRLGLTQHQFADLIGCQPGTISLWETGKHKPLRISVKFIRKAYKQNSGKVNIFRQIFSERF